MDYYKLSFTISPLSDESREILTAVIGDLAFESFEDSDNGIIGYIPVNTYNSEEIEEGVELARVYFESLSFETEYIKDENWNSEWEKNFQPVIHENKLAIKPSFYTEKMDQEFVITIHPKMAFGTGHHSTTWTALLMMLELEFSNKRVLDMGCGTGVLAILAHMKGASQITAIDIDEWAYNNTVENFDLNGVNDAKILLGGAELLKEMEFDTILANINRNILLNDMHHYTNVLAKGGNLIMSGFYSEDLPIIEQKANELGLTKQRVMEHNNWIVAEFK